MSANLRLPNIPDGTPQEQMRYMRSYMYQLVEQLQWALDNIDKQATATTSATTVVQVGTSSKPTPSSSSIDAEATFEAIKSLIIKSAEIVDAYYEEINNKLEGAYLAVSDFGEYSEQTSQEIVENSQSIDRTFNSTQEIRTNVNKSLDSISGEVGQVDSKVDGVKTELATDIKTVQEQVEALNYLVDIKAHINMGVVDTVNGSPVYGIEVGQTTTENGEIVYDKFARFTADRLSFYDQNGTEVAYISDYKLHITNADITGNFQLGGLVSTVLPSYDVVEKWVGRR